MLFNSWTFLFFAPIVLFLYHTLPRRWRSGLLLVASYTFYGWWDWRFLSLLLISTFVDYEVARRIEDRRKAEPSARLMPLLAWSLLTNLGMLAFFKYTNFFLDSAIHLLNSLGLHVSPVALSIVLPVGISFYSFQTLAYTIDVYRGDAPAVRDPLLFALYVTYFPQLVAGPIERPGVLVHQLERPARVTFEPIVRGLALIVLGFFRKVVLADGVAPTVDAVFHNYKTLPAETLLAGAWLFSFQIYNDFSGYVDIGRGVSRLLGVELSKNFEQPYLAVTITEFWRRWHMTLSFWLRDYLYIPLGGSRRGAGRTYFNLFVTMVLAGLWHGAAWTFVLFGFLHGVYLMAERWLEHRGLPAATRVPSSLPGLLLRWLVTFQLVHLGFLAFRCQDLQQFWVIFSRICTWGAGGGPEAIAAAALPANPWLVVALAGGTTLLFDLAQRAAGFHEFMLRWRPLYAGLLLGVLIVLTLLWSNNPGAPFIYFQF